MAGWGMSGRGQTLRNLRVEASGIVQMLLLAILLQLSFPVSASLAGTAAPLSLDDSSICSSRSGQHDAQDLDGTPVPNGHCVFCLPLLSMAAPPVVDTIVPVPNGILQEAVPVTVPPVLTFAVVRSGDARGPPILR